MDTEYKIVPNSAICEENLPAPTEQNSSETASDVLPERKKYHERHYLLFGGSKEPDCIDPNATKAFLKELGFDKSNFLTQAREGRELSIAISSSYQPDKPNSRYCDFCGTEIFGVEYETLADGRDRCLQCSKTAIKSGEEFKAIFDNVRLNMEAFFGIRLNVGVRVRMVNSRTLHKELNHTFTPTPDPDGRVLGVAIRHRDGSFSLLVENGSPRMASVMTIAHELTHIWQYTNWNRRQIRRKYGKAMELEIYEGMAKWVEVQYAYLINEPALAKRTEIMTCYRDDEYGRGFLRYRANYPFSLGTYITKNTPFMFPEEPLSLDFCGEITILPPRDDGMGLPPDSDETPKRTPRPPRAPSTPTAPRIQGAIERDPENPPLYARSLLSAEEQAVYDIFLEALLEFKPVITELPMEMTANEVFMMFEKVLVDHPEIFWFRFNETCYCDTQTDKVVKIELAFRYTKEEVNVARAEIIAVIQPFLDTINDDMSDFEVALRAYETLVNLVDYDTIALEKQEKIPPLVKQATPDPIRTIYGVFVDRKAVCAGYARAYQFLLKLMGIEAAYVSSGVHAWNLVKLEGDYYHLDVTWADASDTKRENNGGNAINYSFFCVTTAEITALDSHNPKDIIPLPDCTATKCNYHHRFGLYFEKYSAEAIRDALCISLQRDKSTFSLKFSSMRERDKAFDELHSGGKMGEIMRWAAAQTGISLTHYSCNMPDNIPVLNFYF